MIWNSNYTNQNLFRAILTVFFLFATYFSSAQKQYKSLTSSELYERIKQLNVLGSVLYIAAHPDDENTKLIAYLSKYCKARTAYLSLTRGGGGQNLIGSEIREALGVLRTQELLASRRIDGGEQLFTRANDFGYSKKAKETLTIWNKDSLLHDVILAIRRFKPDVIINRFDHRTNEQNTRKTHGHHTASAQLSVEAFGLAALPTAFPDQLTKCTPWQTKRLFFNTSWWFYGSKKKFDTVDKSNFLSFDTGLYYPSLGVSNNEIAALSRSQHKSQGFGSSPKRGSNLEYLELLKGDMPNEKTNIFEGIDISWNRVDGGKKIENILNAILQEYDFKSPAKSIPKLVEVYQHIQNLNNNHWKAIKTKEIKAILLQAAGLHLEASTNTAVITPNSELSITMEAINRSNYPIVLQSIDMKSVDYFKKIDQNLGSSQKIESTFRILVPEDMAYSSPHWLKPSTNAISFAADRFDYIGKPEGQAAFCLRYNLLIQGVPIDCTREVMYKTNDPIRGAVRKPLAVLPKIAINPKDEVVVFVQNKPKKIQLQLQSLQSKESAHSPKFKNNLKGSISLGQLKNWVIQPNHMDFELKANGETKTFTFWITPPNFSAKGVLYPKANSKGQQYNQQVLAIEYDHIPKQTIVRNTTIQVVKMDVQKKGDLVGYIQGAGDLVPQGIERLGYLVDILDPKELKLDQIAKYTAIVMGIRAYNTVEALVFKQEILLDYVKNGGNLIVQYNTNHRLKVKKNIGPYPIQLSRDRVTEEQAEVVFINPKHPVLHTPNTITLADFDHWVQERGLYFPKSWSAEYEPIVAMKDEGESIKKGALLIAQYGKGYFVYTGLSFFRQFPAAVSGAYRLFANLLSLEK